MSMNYMRGSVDQYRGLESLASDISDDGTLVEIGSYLGESAVMFSLYFGKVVAIDPWEWTRESFLAGFTGEGGIESFDSLPEAERVEEVFDQTIKELSNVVKCKSFDSEVVDGFDDLSLSAVYIDSKHTFDAVRETAERWWPKIKHGGFLCGHDYNEKSWMGVKKAVDLICEGLGQTPVIYPDSSWRFSKEKEVIWK